MTSITAAAAEEVTSFQLPQHLVKKQTKAKHSRSPWSHFWPELGGSVGGVYPAGRSNFWALGEHDDLAKKKIMVEKKILLNVENIIK